MPKIPFVSVDPILALSDFCSVLEAFCGPIIAVSPIVGGEAINGPAAKMMRELGLPCSVAGIAAHYRGQIGGLIIDAADRAQADEVTAQSMAVRVEQTVMCNMDDKVTLARACLDFADALAMERMG